MYIKMEMEEEMGMIMMLLSEFLRVHFLSGLVVNASTVFLYVYVQLSVCLLHNIFSGVSGRLGVGIVVAVVVVV